VAARQERGLLAHREGRASASAQSRVLELLEDLLGGHLLVRLVDRPVAAELAVGVDRSQSGLVDVPEQQTRLLARHQPSTSFASGAPASLRSSRRFSGRTCSPAPLSCSTAVAASSSVSGP